MKDIYINIIVKNVKSKKISSICLGTNELEAYFRCLSGPKAKSSGCFLMLQGQIGLSDEAWKASLGTKKSTTPTGDS